MKNLFLYKLVLYSISTFLVVQVSIPKLCAQRSEDAIRVSNMGYMQYANAVDCDSIEGVSLYERICLNIEFQKVDSILTRRMNTYILMSDDLTERRQKRNYHNIWLENRRFHSNSIARSFNGHYKGIYYLELMIISTKKRIEELEMIFGIFEVQY